MQFHKYHALGNDMIVIDPAQFRLTLTPARVRLICDRHHGVGADGICYGPLPQPATPPTMRFFNPDGTEAEKSGNGLCVFARYVWDRGEIMPQFTIAIWGEPITVTVLDEEARQLALGIGQLSFGFVEEVMQFGEWAGKATAVSIGNPHCVIFSDDLSAIHSLGPVVERAPQFPNRTNVQLARVVNEETVAIEIWERGAGYTLASGSSASAVAGAAIKTGRCRSPVTVQMPGGDVLVDIDNDWHVVLTGAVTAVYQGEFTPEFLEQLRGE